MMGLKMAKEWLIDRKAPADPYSCIPVDHPTLTHAQTIIPPEWWGNTWIAGSAATRFGQHSDVDLWITQVPRHLDAWTLLPVNQTKEPDDTEEYERVALKIYNQDGLQIMATEYNIHQLLGHFDISVHCGAMHVVTGEQIRGSGYSEKVLIINYISNKPVLTLTRYLTFAKRYKDFSGMFSESVQKCASETFYLKTPAQAEQMLRDNYVDRGL